MKKIIKVLLLTTIFFFCLSMYYFVQEDPKHTCYSGCDSHLTFLIKPIKNIFNKPLVSSKTSALEGQTKPLESQGHFCAQACFIAKHPLFYIFCDIFILNIIITSVFYLKNKHAKK